MTGENTGMGLNERASRMGKVIHNDVILDKKGVSKMRKLISTILVSVMSLSLGLTCVHAGQDNSLTGDWTMEYSFGGAVIADLAVTIRDDSTFEVSDDGQSETGTWSYDGETLSLLSDGEEIKLKWDEGAGVLTGEYGGMTVSLRAADERDGGDATAKGGSLMGGWAVSDDYEVTSEIEQLLWTALDGYQTGTITVSYTPVAYLGSQVVAGTNHAVLCRADEINKGSSWVIIFLYEDLQGDVSVMNIADFDFGSFCTYGAD